MVIAGPGVAKDQVSRALVETIDLGATLCELCSVEPHERDQGRSLMPILTGEVPNHRATVYAEMGCDKMIRDDRYKLMWGDPSIDTRELGRLHLNRPVDIAPSPRRLYDLQEDPHELWDLSQSDLHLDLLMAMMAKLLVRMNENVQAQPMQDRGEYRPLRAGGLPRE